MLKKWSEREINLLKELYPTKSISCIVKKLNRNENSIHLKANRLGLHKDDYRWMDEEVSLLLYLFNKDLLYKEIANVMGKTVQSIKDKVYNLKLNRQRLPLRKSHKQHIGITRKQMMKENPNILKKMNDVCREYHKTHENTCPVAGWNKGMKPWEWMHITKNEFHKIATSKSNTKPTSIERRVIRLCEENDLPYKYVGDFKVWIDGKNPDFMNCNGEKKLIELFGNHWHKKDDEITLPDHYKKYGFKTLVIWENDMKNQSDENLVKLIREFENV